MRTPSMTASASRSWVAPIGQMTCTSHPASRSATLSCQTRRSSGTERFSTRMSALPANAHVVPSVPERRGLRHPYEIDHLAAEAVEFFEHGRVGAADHAHLGVVQHFGHRV